MSNSITSTSSNALRITGMATGLDTDTLIKQMMAAENVKVDKLKQNQQYTVWRQEAFRDIIKDFRDLRTSYLLIDSPSDTNMIKSATYSGAITTTSGDNADILTATALPGAINGISSVAVKQLASSAKIEGKGLNLSKAITGTEIENFKGATLTFGEAGSITLDNTFNDIDGLVKNINDKITANPALKGKVSVLKEVTGSEDYLRFNIISSDNIKLTEITKDTNDISDITGLQDLKNKTLNTTLNTKLEDLGVSDKIEFTINLGTRTSSKISLTKDKTIQDLITAINDAYSVGTDSNSSRLYNDIQVSYSDLTKGITIQTRATGSTQVLKITADVGNADILSKLGLDTIGREGKNAIVEITPPGSTTATEVIKTSNNFTIDNVTYNLTKESPVDATGKSIPTTLTTQANAEDSVKKIKAFIEKYNALVKKINDKLVEKKDYNYKPLTADQKKDMEEDDIKAWEEKAKKGILKNDGDLQQILFSMRNAFMSGMDSAGIKISEVGIDTYGGLEAVSKPGQLKVDEAKLKKALEERGDQVMKLFAAGEPSDSTLPSTMPSKYTDAGKWQEQYKYDNTGIFRRIESIINNSAGKFDSILLKKAGYEGTVSEFTNTITKQIQDQDKAISELNRKLYDKQERYYQMFARLESAMNQMNSQQSWLAQQLGQ